MPGRKQPRREPDAFASVCRTLFTGVKQIGIVTADLDRSVRIWQDKYGVGPWIITEPDPNAVEEETIGGSPVKWAGRRSAHARLGSVYIELTEPREDDTDTIHARSLAAHDGRDHLHHLMFDTEDADRTREWLEDLGVTSDQGGRVRLGYGVKFDWMATVDDLGFWVEVVDPTVLDRLEFQPDTAPDA